MERLADEVATVRARRAFQALVPAEVGAGCELLLFRDGELCIYAHQGAWASWLRNRTERLLEGLDERRAGVKRLRVVVAPRGAVDGRRPVEKPLPPSAEAAGLVRQSADAATDPGLKRALGRLARRLAACQDEGESS